MERPAMPRSLSARLAAHGAGITLVASLAAIAVAAGFILARQGSSELPVAANPEEREPGWFLPLLEADRQKPPLDGVVNVIRLGPDASQDWTKVCGDTRARYVEPAEARGTLLGPITALSIPWRQAVADPIRWARSIITSIARPGAGSADTRRGA